MEAQRANLSTAQIAGNIANPKILAEMEDAKELESVLLWNTEWNEPNRFNCDALHIADGGDWMPECTGVTFLNEELIAGAHHASGRIAIFNIHCSTHPILKIDCPFAMDDIASKRISEREYEIVVSGNWEAHYATYRLTLDKMSGQPSMKLMAICRAPVFMNKNVPKTFSHSVLFIEGSICVCLHTGHSPRIDINHGEKIIRVPNGLYPTAACWHEKDRKLFIGTNHQVPDKEGFQGSGCSIWKADLAKEDFELVTELQSSHIDSMVLAGHKLWFNNQYQDAIMTTYIDGRSCPVRRLRHKSIGFPHGIDIYENRLLAVSNYKPSGISIFDISAL